MINNKIVRMYSRLVECIQVLSTLVVFSIFEISEIRTKGLNPNHTQSYFTQWVDFQTHPEWY